METRGRAVSRARIIRAPRFESLEDRRLLSVAILDTGADSPQGGQIDRAIVQSSASSINEGVDLTAAAAKTSSMSSASAIRSAASSSSASEAPIAVTTEGVSSSSSSDGAVKNQSVSSSLPSMNSSTGIEDGGDGGSPGLSITPTRSSIAVATVTTPASNAVSSVSSVQTVSSSSSTAQIQSLSAEDEAVVASRAAIAEPDESGLARAPVEDSATGADLRSGDLVSSGSGGTGSATIAASAGTLPGPSGASGLSRNAAGALVQVVPGLLARGPEEDLGIAAASAAEKERVVPSASDPEQPATASVTLDSSRIGLGGDSSSSRAADPRLEVASLSLEPASAEAALEAPRPADLLTSFLPYDRASVETAIDTFLDHFEGLGAGLTDIVDLGHVVPAIVAVTAVTAASTVMLRRRRNRAGDQKSTAHTQAILDLFTSPSNLWKLGEI
jgi:hypothetical protein